VFQRPHFVIIIIILMYTFDIVTAKQSLVAIGAVEATDVLWLLISFKLFKFLAGGSSIHIRNVCDERGALSGYIYY